MILELEAGNRPQPDYALYIGGLLHNQGAGMDISGLVIFLAIGAVAGWLGSTLMKGGGFALIKKA